MNGRVRGPDRQVGAASSRPQLNWNFETETLNFGLLNFQLTYEMRSGSNTSLDDLSADNAHVVALRVGLCGHHTFDFVVLEVDPRRRCRTRSPASSGPSRSTSDTAAGAPSRS